MSSDDRLIAARYVEALFDLACEGKQHDAVKADMLVLKSAVAASPELGKLLANPVMDRETSEKAIAAVMGALEISDLTTKFFALLARNRRLSIAPLAIDAYLARLAESRDELAVEVTAAQDLSVEDTQALARSIGKATGKKVEIKAHENPALIGGLQVRVGSRLLDNSIAGKLARLKQALKKAA